MDTISHLFKCNGIIWYKGILDYKYRILNWIIVMKFYNHENFA